MNSEPRKRTFLTRGIFACVCLALALLASACFRDNAESIERQPVAREVASPTLVDTETPPPTPTTAMAEEIASEPPPDTFALTATALIARLTEAADADEAATAVDEPAAATEAPRIQPTAAPLIRVTVQPGQDCIHEVRAGETLYMLSLAYGAAVNDIADASGITDPDRIVVGQRITIPLCGTAGFAPPPTSVPTATPDPDAITATPPEDLELVAAPAAENNERGQLVQQAQDTILNNAQESLSAGFSIQTAPTATPSRRYTVRQGETLLEIALRYNTTLATLAALNNISDVDDVTAGDVLLIP